MELTFRKDIVTTVPTSCLIEDYQNLRQAVQEQNWELVNVVMECLAEVIDSHTTVPEGLEINPSVSSVIVPSHEVGIAMSGNKDIRCAMGRDISYAMSGGVCQCDDGTCPYWGKKCFPEDGNVVLENGVNYCPRGVLSEDRFMKHVEGDPLWYAGGGALKPCEVCGCQTRLRDLATEAPICSESCDNIHMDVISVLCQDGKAARMSVASMIMQQLGIGESDIEAFLNGNISVFRDGQRVPLDEKTAEVIEYLERNGNTVFTVLSLTHKMVYFYVSNGHVEQVKQNLTQKSPDPLSGVILHDETDNAFYIPANVRNADNSTPSISVWRMKKIKIVNGYIVPGSEFQSY